VRGGSNTQTKLRKLRLLGGIRSVLKVSALGVGFHIPAAENQRLACNSSIARKICRRIGTDAL
jgi:hypothetical protein